MGETRQAIPAPNTSWEELKPAIEYAVKALNVRLNRRIECGLCEVQMGNGNALITLPRSPLAFSQSLRIVLSGGEVVGTLTDLSGGPLNVFGPRKRKKRIESFMYDIVQALAGKMTAIEPPVVSQSILVRGSLVSGALLLIVFGLASAFGVNAVQKGGGLKQWMALLFCLAATVAGLVLFVKAIVYKLSRRK